MAEYSPSEIRQIRQVLLRWGRSHFADFPWRTEEDPWLALVAEVLLQRTRASIVSDVFERFGRQYPTPESAAAATDKELKSIIGGLGLHWRIPLVRRLAQEIVLYRGVPNDLDALQSLPGVGPYAAAAYLSLHAGRRAVIIDANVVRWLCRMTGSLMHGETRRQLWVRELADALTPPRAFRNHNYAVLDFTMQICAAKPRCEVCPLLRFCDYGMGRLGQVGLTR